MAVEIVVKETARGLEILSGKRRLDQLFKLKDEVVVRCAEVGDVVFAKLPDGRITASAKPEHVAIFR